MKSEKDLQYRIRKLSNLCGLFLEAAEIISIHKHPDNY